MPRIGDPTPKIPYPGTLTFEHQNNTSVYVYYVPSPERLRERRTSLEDVDNPRAKLLQFDAQDGKLTIFPIRTKTTVFGNILERKYSQIERISIASREMLDVDFDHKLPSSEHEVMEILEELPSCFVKDFDFGLGMTQRHRYIVQAAEELTDCKEILISDLAGISVDAGRGVLVISNNDFEWIRRTVNKNNTDGLSDIRDASHEDVRNHVAKELGLSLLLPRTRTLQRVVSGSRNAHSRSFSQSKHGVALDKITEHSRSIAKDNPSEFSMFQRGLQIVSFDSLIEHYEDMMSKPRLPEGAWQKFLEANDFALSSAFGYPVVQVHAQPSLGGRRFSGTGDNVADFLVKNSLTYNAAIVEIKKPSTKLLNEKQYRSGVYSPSSDLSGAINQALIQKYHFEQEIAQFKENTEERDIRTYSVFCFLLVGTMPTDSEQIKSFEIFRGNSKDVVVMTFDELLAKIKQIREFLTLRETDPELG